MSTSQPDQNETLTRLNQETAKIHWQELQPHYARGAIVHVAQPLDLVKVGYEFSTNNSQQVSEWMTNGSVNKATDEQAAQWSQTNTEFWAVVVAPWILIQPIN